jgi:hypothetical protein
MARKWMVVYPRGDRSKIDVAEVGEWDQIDYDLASRREFEDEVEAALYARKLAEGAKLIYHGPHAYLDEESE